MVTVQSQFSCSLSRHPVHSLPAVVPIQLPSPQAPPAGMCDGAATSESTPQFLRILVLSYHVTQQFHSRYTFKRSENVCPNQTFDTNTHCSIIHSSQKVEKPID